MHVWFLVIFGLAVTLLPTAVLIYLVGFKNISSLFRNRLVLDRPGNFLHPEAIQVIPVVSTKKVSVWCKCRQIVVRKSGGTKSCNGALEKIVVKRQTPKKSESGHLEDALQCQECGAIYDIEK